MRADAALLLAGLGIRKLSMAAPAISLIAGWLGEADLSSLIAAVAGALKDDTAGQARGRSTIRHSDAGAGLTYGVVTPQSLAVDSAAGLGLRSRERDKNLGADCGGVEARLLAALGERGDAVSDRVHKSDSAELALGNGEALCIWR